MGKRDGLDRFYTQGDVVEACLAFLTGEMGVAYGRFDAIVEPSAGAGAFSSRLPERRLAYDIEPANGTDGIERRDWFSVGRDEVLAGARVARRGGRQTEVLVVGNPPFGVRSSLAKRFVAHAVGVGATTVAFVLPDVFAKRSNQRCFPDAWRLVGILGLRRDAFTIGGEPYHVPCSFFVWTQSDDIMPGRDLREAPVPQPEEFSYLGRGDMRAHFTVNGNSGRVRDVADVTNPKAEHYVRVSDGYDAEEIRGRMESLDLRFRSSASGGVAWVNRDDINRAWRDAYGQGAESRS